MADDKTPVRRSVGGTPGNRVADVLGPKPTDGNLPAIIKNNIPEAMAEIARDNHVAELAKKCGFPPVMVDQFNVDTEVTKLLPRDFAILHGVLPLYEDTKCVIIATSDPKKAIEIEQELQFRFHKKIEWVLDTPDAIESATLQYYGVAPLKDYLIHLDSDDLTVDSDSDVDELEKESKDQRVVKLVDFLVTSAVDASASDIHIEPFEKQLRVRFRVDGVLREMPSPPQRLHRAIVSRIKIISGLNIAERRRSQDGHFKMRVTGGAEIDFRVSIMPTIHGEKAVLRIQDRRAVNLDLSKLGFSKLELETFRSALANPWGLILVTGPTGSGKSTTLYSALSELNQVGCNISTVEDPVEIPIEGVNQVQVDDVIGQNFPTVLRTFLRQDPNIIMVGEIRDFETAEVAMKASLTGHLVLSTLHTNDAVSAINRLVGMGIEPFLIASALSLVCAQRLVRLSCTKCGKERYLPEKHHLTQLHMAEYAELAYYRSTGKKVGNGECQYCGGSGFKGRTGLYELMQVTPELKDAIAHQVDASDLARIAMKHGMVPLRESGVKQILTGATTVDEVARVVQ
jgi:type IV pilus assembly protein PilB